MESLPLVGGNPLGGLVPELILVELGLPLVEGLMVVDVAPNLGAVDLPMLLDLAALEGALLPSVVGGLVDGALAIGLVVLPLALVDVSIWVITNSLPTHFALFELPLVLALVRPDHDALSFHLVVLELPGVDLAGVSEVVLAVALELSIHEVAFVLTTLELELSLSCLLALLEVTLVLDGTEVPLLSALAVLEVLVPVAVVEAALVVAEYALSVGLALLPVSPVNIAIGMGHHSPSIKLSILSLTLVPGSVGEDDGAEPSPLGLRLGLLVWGVWV